MRLALAAALLPVVLLVVGFTYHWIASRRERRRHPPNGKLIAVDAARLNLVSSGQHKTGWPTVVLDSALAGTSLSWSEIQPKLAETTRVVSYDRAGFGWSDASAAPRTAENMAAELAQLLDNADVDKPYVLVGHSYGGWIAQLYASTHRQHVAGLVLVDVPHPRTWMSPDEAQRRRVARGARLARRAAVAARFGLMRLLFLVERVRVFGEHDKVAELLGKTPSAIRAPLRTFWVQPKTLEALASQIENAPASAAKVFEQTRELGDMPLVVLTATDPDAERLKDQEQTAALSRRGRHVIASGSGHWIPLDEPELVIEAVRDVVKSSR